MQEVDFHRVTIADKDWIKAKLAEDDENFCERSFSTIFLYSRLYQTEVAELFGCCVLRCNYSTMKEMVPYWTYSFPMGQGDRKKALEVMLELCCQEGIPLHMDPISIGNRQQLLTWFPGRFRIDANRDHFDYIYSREKLATLKGKKMQKKRNHIARFKDGDDWSYEAITQANLAEVRFMAKNWICSRSDKWNQDMENEFLVLEEAFNNFAALELRGGILRKGGEIVAFSIGEPLNSDTFLVHFEKAFPEVQGAYPMINQQFIQQAAEGFTYVNREDDMGDLGLRKAKMSYYPELLQRKYNAETSDVVFADPERDKAAISEIWQQCFGDSQAFIDFYLANRMDDVNMLVVYRDGKAVSMASLLPVDIQTATGNLEGYYVYAVATLPKYQGQGLSTHLLEVAQQHWQKPLLLSPAESSLRIFYAKRGFQPIYEKKYYALQPDYSSGADMAYQVEAASAEAYKTVRDAKWQGPGYVAWQSPDIAYAMKHAAFGRGESLLLTAGDRQEILMYTIQGDSLRVVETTLCLEQLRGVLPLLAQRVKKYWPDNPELEEFAYHLPDGMIWMPESLKSVRLKRRGYFNLVLD